MRVVNLFLYLIFIFGLGKSLLVTTSGDATARVWKTCDFKLWRELKDEDGRWIWDAAFSADSQYLFTGNNVFCSPKCKQSYAI